jgi:hypothetical protein
MIADRSEVTNMIRAAKVVKNIKWSDVAAAIGKSKEWTTAACLGQMAFTKEQAEKIGAIFELNEEAIAWLQIAPYKGSLPTAVPTDPLIYRWYDSFCPIKRIKPDAAFANSISRLYSSKHRPNFSFISECSMRSAIHATNCKQAVHDALSGSSTSVTSGPHRNPFISLFSSTSQ